MDAFKMDDKVCIVTGSSSGIGAATAFLLASRGASVTLCGMDETRLASSVAKCIDASGGHFERFLSVKGDVTDKTTRKEIVQRTVEKFGRIDVLVANAGITRLGDELDTLTEEIFDNIVDVNMKSTVFIIQEAKEYLEKSKGNIVVVSSLISVFPQVHSFSYAMTKAALDHMTRCLALDLGPKGIRINAVNPGFTRNGSLIFREIGSHIADTLAERETRLAPLQKTADLTIEDCAETIAFLASSAARYISGENIKIDGGRIFAGHRPGDELSF